MEVHAHTHTARKKWTHYLWEFLMLFLAVFCGFLAENKREKIVEQHRAKDYAKSLNDDIKLDQDELARGINQTRFMIDAIDSLVVLSAKINKDGLVSGKFYYYGRFATSTFRIDWGKSTIDQLIQSGNLRYFTNKDLVGAINFYYYMQGIINEQNKMDMIHRDKIMDYRNQVFQSKYFARFVSLDPRNELKNPNHPDIDSLLQVQLPLQQGAGQFMDELINHVLERKARLSLIVERYYPLADTIAKDISNGLMETYHLK
jgi:hypothetical protein